MVDANRSPCVPDSPAGARIVVPAHEVDAAYQRLLPPLQSLVEAEQCVLMGLLMGGMIPLVRLAGMLRGDFILDYCHLSRYRGGTTGAAVQWIQPPRQPLAGRTVVLVDDIFDRGYTLAALKAHCVSAGATRVVIAVLAEKEHQRPRADLRPDHVGLMLGDRYVFGCGMDLHERWRHLPAIYARD